MSLTLCSTFSPLSPTDGEQNCIVNGNDDYSSSSVSSPDVGFSLPKFKSKQMHNKVSPPTDLPTL